MAQLLRRGLTTDFALLKICHCSGETKSFLRHATTCNQLKLCEVGRFEEPKQKGSYEPGQLFLHRIFGYRAAVSFPWMARVYDRDAYKKSGKFQEHVGNRSDFNTKMRKFNGTTMRPSNFTSSNSTSSTSNSSTSDKNSSSMPPTNVREMHPERQPYYQVLIDERDCPYVRAQTEAVTFLRNNDPNRSFYTIPGLDYVSHDDIIPYASTNCDQSVQPIQHELFDQFLMHTANKLTAPPYEASERLKDWQFKNQAWLKLSEVHRETTENVRVTVMPFYMGCREAPGLPVYWWRYCVRLENLGEMAVQLRERHWRIFSLSGTLQTVRGRGVIGQEPVLCPRLPAFQYSSHINLHVPSGHMWGSLRFEREDGFTFDCKVPPFSLDSQPEEGTKVKPLMPNAFTRSNSSPKSEE